MLKVLGETRRGVQLVVTAAGLAAAVVAGAAVPAAAAPAVPAARQAVGAPSVFAWGNNEDGQLGDGTTTERDSPVPVSGLPAGVQQVAVSETADFSAALLADHTVSAWGANGFGQLGNDSTVGTRSPGPVAGLTGITQISAGGGHMLAVGSGGAVWSWGNNDSGQLGNGTAGNTTNTDVPGRVSGLTGIIQVAAGDSSSLALRSDGTVWAWGDNSSGQLGNGTTRSRNVPGQVPGLTGINQIAGSGVTGYALRSDGTVFSWGGNGLGVLGNGTTGGFTTAAAPVPGLAGVTQVSTSGLTTLAIAGASGTVFAWGDGSAGEIGDGTTDNHASPKPIGLSGITQVGSGIFVSAAVRSDGALLTWGDNGLGELGIGTAGGPSRTPVQVGSLIGVSRVSMSNGYGLAIGRSAFAAVPDVGGDTSSGASQALQAAGFALGGVSAVTDNTCNNIGTVISQNPAAGTTLPIGSAVSITIGQRPRHPCP